jgi:hypothetical protein
LTTLINSDDQSNDQSDKSQTLNEATQRSDWSKWEIVMRVEFNSLVENQTWDLIKRLSQNVIIDRWTFRLKRDRDDNSQRYKVRWMTHDFKQRHEIVTSSYARNVLFQTKRTLLVLCRSRASWRQVRHALDVCYSHRMTHRARW